MQTVAIIGSGIAGLSCAYFLAPHFSVTLFEKNDYSGGHTNTIVVPPCGAESEPVAMDTGFMVFNHETYPYLTRLFSDLGVATKKTDMSFSVQYLPDKIEWNGAGLNKVFAQRRNLLSPRFWRMLKELDWFNKNAYSQLLDGGAAKDGSSIVHQTVQDYVVSNRLSEDFLNWYLIPMGASVWSTPADKMLSFPVAALIRFFHNHGFLGLDTHFQWYTVVGGARNYVPLISASFKNSIRHSAAVRSVRVIGEGPDKDCNSESSKMVEVICHDGSKETFDKVVFACHADEALAALAAPTALQRALLSPFKYQTNKITVHSDSSVMPDKRLAWASWNYRVTAAAPTLHYWMNSLQGVSDRENYFVSLNSDSLIKESKVHKKLEYTHPVFDLKTFEAQKSLSDLHRLPDNQIYFCGSYFRNGFHEDALASAVDLASTILGRRVY